MVEHIGHGLYQCAHGLTTQQCLCTDEKPLIRVGCPSYCKGGKRKRRKKSDLDELFAAFDALGEPPWTEHGLRINRLYDAIQELRRQHDGR